MGAKARTRRVIPLIISILLNCSIVPPVSLTEVKAQERIIVITAEQPKAWTLEQAHYLLARMRRHSLDPKAKNPEASEPNEIDGLRFDLMRLLAEFGANLNQKEIERLDGELEKSPAPPGQ